MMMKKKAAVLLLLFALMFTATVSATDRFLLLPETFGAATHYGDGIIRVTGFALTDGAYDDLLLYAGGAPVYDLRTGYPAYLEDIVDGAYVRAVYDTNATLQGYENVVAASTIYFNADAHDAANFRTIVSDNIWYGDGACAFVSNDGKYRVTISDETIILDSSGMPLEAENIMPGMEMFVWAAFITASFPGEVIPDKIVLIDSWEL